MHLTPACACTQHSMLVAQDDRFAEPQCSVLKLAAKHTSADACPWPRRPTLSVFEWMRQVKDACYWCALLASIQLWHAQVLSSGCDR